MSLALSMITFVIGIGLGYILQYGVFAEKVEILDLMCPRDSYGDTAFRHELLYTLNLRQKTMRHRKDYFRRLETSVNAHDEWFKEYLPGEGLLIGGDSMREYRV